MEAFGIDIRGGSGIFLRCFYSNSDNSPMSSGLVNFYFEEPQNNMTTKSFDFSDYSFKTGALTQAGASGTHLRGNNNTRDTGLWTYMLPITSGFTDGNIYFAQASSTYGGWQSREFQYGSGIFASVVHVNPSSVSAIQNGLSTFNNDVEYVTVDSLTTNAKNNVSEAVHLSSSVTYGLTPSTMGRLIHNGGASSLDTTINGFITPSSIYINGGSASGNFYKDMIAYIDEGSAAGQARPIIRSESGIIYFDESLEVLPASGQRLVIRAAHNHPVTQIADIILGRDFSQVTEYSNRSLLNGLRFLRNNWYTSGNPPYLYVCEENDTTIAWSGALSIVNGGSGITGMDPF